MRKRLFEIIEADDPADGYDTASTITAGYIRALNRRMEPRGGHVEMLLTPEITTQKTEKV